MPDPSAEGALEGALYVVATPIGNRADLSPRAREILRRADWIACEDTRITQRILEDSRPPGQTLSACHEHNERETANTLADRVAEGRAVALVSDAGTPAISDPGFRAVRECRRRGLKVIPIPGPSAAVAAISVSGLPSDGFLFAGFLPPRSAARRNFLEKYRDFEYTLVLYESTHRIEKMLADIEAVLGPERTVCVARELTKRFETIHSGTVAEIRPRLQAGSTKGEFVLLIARDGFVL